MSLINHFIGNATKVETRREFFTATTLGVISPTIIRIGVIITTAQPFLASPRRDITIEAARAAAARLTVSLPIRMDIMSCLGRDRRLVRVLWRGWPFSSSCLNCRGLKENREASAPEKKADRASKKTINPNLIVIILIEGSKGHLIRSSGNDVMIY